LAGVDPTAYSRIENGHVSPTVTTLEKLARALKVHISELFPPNPSPRR
jgi:transcriptional regulator with XRE-family HTH domain